MNIFEDGPYEVGGETDHDESLVPVPANSYLGRTERSWHAYLCRGLWGTLPSETLACGLGTDPAEPGACGHTAGDWIEALVVLRLDSSLLA